MTEGSDPAEVCTLDNICDEDARILSWQVDYSDSRSLDNWIQRLDLTCEPAWKASILGTILAFAQCLTLLPMPRLADRIGRKWVLKIARIFDCIFYTLVVVTRSYTVTLIALIGLGMVSPGRLNVGLPYMNEWLPRSKQTLMQVVRLLEQSTIFIF